MAFHRKEFYSLLFYEYGEAYFASSDGMRARLAREPLQNVHWTPRSFWLHGGPVPSLTRLRRQRK